MFVASAGLHLQSQADPATLEHVRESKQEKFDLLTIPRYVRKKNVRRGNRYGLSSEQGACGRSNKIICDDQMEELLLETRMIFERR